jgi:2-polyprenyl-3-methyl-5-hydroxy-6-metoxy-1,4-benzoquinol methylase
MSAEDRTRDFFDGYADDFDAIYGSRNGLINSVVNRLFRKSMKLRYEKTIEGCRPIEGKSVLDIGCGPGHYSVTLAKRGAGRVLGIDVAEGMLRLGTEHARQAGVADICEFHKADFYTFSAADAFDYLILTGIMDYIPDPKKVIEKAISLTRSKAFFSFPVDGGLLAWQRAQRYQKRCDLFLYTEDQLRALFSSFHGIHANIEPISRDFFVTVSVASKLVGGGKEPAPLQF